ncbi:MAG: hypothetical protein KAS15_01360 [Nanoarchaeota archaeon]|nr:hypothetical protein [Nanoarchaeota archaeon]MCK5630187.1 hypothetical protein [Nanoarchaeota archaeon]
MNIIEKAFKGLFPDKELKHDLRIKYSGKFSSYNANVKYTPKLMEFGLSRDWRKVDEDIRIGLFQSLLAKVFKTKKSTINMDLYNLFIKNLHTAIPKTMTEPVLEESFSRVNESYFLGMVENPNLKWGQHSTTKLGSYDYHSDTISISRIFEESDKHLLDFVMFHEMLHKVHKFKVTNGRNLHHSILFKKTEKEFENSTDIEKQIARHVQSWKRNVVFKGSGRRKVARYPGNLFKAKKRFGFF